MSDPSATGKERYEYEDEVLRRQDDRHAGRARDLAREGIWSEARRQASKIEHYPRNDDLLDEIRDLKRSRARADGGEPQETGTDRKAPEDVVTDRDPSEMEHSELRSEWKQVHEVYYERSLDVDEDDLLFSRIQQLWREMERRVRGHGLEPEYPACSECSGTESWAQSPGEPLHCTSCGFAETDEETIEAVHAAWSRVTDPEADEAGDRDE